MKINSILVSIPFKRESVSKDFIVSFTETVLYMFQFPSNGKAYPKVAVMPTEIGFRGGVSIPFKRESVSKDLKEYKVDIVKLFLKFQFPSNGKAYPKKDRMT